MRAFLSRSLFFFLVFFLGSPFVFASHNFYSIDVSGASFGKKLDLTSAKTGKPVHLSDYRGQVLVVYFGFSHCHTACPIAMAEWHAVFKALGRRAKKVHLLFVTVDPERDTPSVLKKYIESFGDENFDAAFGTISQIDRASEEFHVYFRKMSMTDKKGQKVTMRMAQSSYTIDHSAVSYIFDKAGKLRLLARTGTTPTKQIADDVRALLVE